MIGQKNLLKSIDILSQNFPKFILIEGPKGSGKKTICDYICNKLGLTKIICGNSIDSVRDTLDLAYSQVDPTCYIFADADLMSIGAKNSLLKVTEEPPKKSYFIMTLEDKGNTLETIQSRATILTLDNYTKEEILQYRTHKGYSSLFDNKLVDVCTTTGEVDDLFANDIINFFKFVENVANNIHIPTTGNIFKISSNLKLSESDTGFNPILVFKAIRTIYISKAIQTKNRKYLFASNATTQCIKDLKLVSVAKLGTIDKWIMDVRRALNATA